MHSETKNIKRVFSHTYTKQILCRTILCRTIKDILRREKQNPSSATRQRDDEGRGFRVHEPVQE